MLYLLSRRTIAGGLAGAFMVLLGLGLWYGWRGVTYAWAAQWSVYGAGVLLLWAWLALHKPLLALPRLHHKSALAAAILSAWFLIEGMGAPALIYPFAREAPVLSDVGLLWAGNWAPLFLWLSVILVGIWFLLLTSNKSNPEST
ncbi:MAG: hypothetical protein NZ580_01645 [Bacteroidia bacterium]|nr:hypothetical protein [Bacteroidia bacterium]